MFDNILVPKGAEAAAVKRGLKRAMKLGQIQGHSRGKEQGQTHGQNQGLADSMLAQASPAVLLIAMGPKATALRLTSALDSGDIAPGSRVLVLGVAGSLSAQLSIGDVVIYDRFVSLGEMASGADLAARPGTLDGEPDRNPNCIPVAQQCSTELKQRLPNAQIVTALSSDRLIHSTQEKAQLQAQTGAQAVDMEAAAIQTRLSPKNIQISTVRVISDDLTLDLPNIEQAINENGELDGLQMALAMVRQPKAAANLIRGSLKALKVLEEVTYKIFSMP